MYMVKTGLFVARGSEPLAPTLLVPPGAPEVPAPPAPRPPAKSEAAARKQNKTTKSLFIFLPPKIFMPTGLGAGKHTRE
jgi:hypothetical protein